MKFPEWLKRLLASPRERERMMDEELLYPLIDAKAKTPEQAEKAKRLHRWIDMQAGE